MVDELLAKLEVGTVSIEPRGGGGIPQLTAQDVAAALAICEDKFAATMYQAIFGGHLHWKEVDQVLAAFQFEQWKARADKLVLAQLAKAGADIATEDQEYLQQRADFLLETARAAMWPPLLDQAYSGIRKALVMELRERRMCAKCGGRRTVQVGTLLVDCKGCLGTGRIPISNSRRAQAAEIPNSTFDRVWRPVYEWMYFQIVAACKRGRDQFEAALGRECP